MCSPQWPVELEIDNQLTFIYITPPILCTVTNPPILDLIANSTIPVPFNASLSRNILPNPGEHSPGTAAYGTVALFFTLLTLSAIIVVAIVGNAFVVAAVLLERNLRNVGNYLTLSLAIADLMVAVLVMPLAAVNQVSTSWFLGRQICDMWVSFDILCCTSSIVHLVAISLDRYWAVTRVDYIHNRSSRRILLMIATSWGLSVAISIPPLFIEKDGESTSHGDEPFQCIISQNLGYTVYSTIGAFYLPCALMIIIYQRVFHVARVRIHKNGFRAFGGSSIERSDLEKPSEVREMTVVESGVDTASNVSYSPPSGRPSASPDGCLRSGTHAKKPLLSISPPRINTATSLNGLCSQPSVVDFPHQKLLLSSRTMEKVPHCSDHELSVLRRTGSTLSPSNARLPRACDLQERPGNLIQAVSALEVTPLLLASPNNQESGSHHERGLIAYDSTCLISTTAEADPSGERKTMEYTRCAGPCSPTHSDAGIHLYSSWMDVRRQYLTTLTSAEDSHRRGESSPKMKDRRAREKIEQRRERKAARTLVIVTGSFIVCWLPFFLVASITPFCGVRCHVPTHLMSVIVWLGYFNSLLNPIIYTVFNPDFRLAFHKILFGKYRRSSGRNVIASYRRPTTISVTSQRTAVRS